MVSKMQKLDASTLKYLVCVLMFVDHIHEMFAPLGLCPHWVDAFGRPVFPIFLFLAADSFHYTHDRKRYLLRLLVASWCMAAITMLTQYLVPSDSIVLMNNAFGTIFVSCLYMAVITLLREGHREKDKKKTRRGLGLLLLSFVGWIPVLIFMLSPDASTGVLQAAAAASLFLPNLLSVEGGPLYVLLGVLFYLFRDRRWAQVLVMALFSLFAAMVSGGVQWALFAAVPLMLLYNGKRGKGSRWFFYIFYPAHIVGLYLIAVLLFA